MNEQITNYCEQLKSLIHMLTLTTNYGDDYAMTLLISKMKDIVNMIEDESEEEL